MGSSVEEFSVYLSTKILERAIFLAKRQGLTLGQYIAGLIGDQVAREHEIYRSAERKIRSQCV